MILFDLGASVMWFLSMKWMHEIYERENWEGFAFNWIYVRVPLRRSKTKRMGLSLHAENEREADAVAEYSFDEPLFSKSQLLVAGHSYSLSIYDRN